MGNKLRTLFDTLSKKIHERAEANDNCDSYFDKNSQIMKNSDTGYRLDFYYQESESNMAGDWYRGIDLELDSEKKPSVLKIAIRKNFDNPSQHVEDNEKYIVRVTKENYDQLNLDALLKQIDQSNFALTKS